MVDDIYGALQLTKHPTKLCRGSDFVHALLSTCNIYVSYVVIYIFKLNTWKKSWKK